MQLVMLTGGIGVGVTVGVRVRVRVLVLVGVNVNVAVAVGVTVGVLVGVGVGVANIFSNTWQPESPPAKTIKQTTSKANRKAFKVPSPGN
jgi:hypothetical protein